MALWGWGAPWSSKQEGDVGPLISPSTLGLPVPVCLLGHLGGPSAFLTLSHLAFRFTNVCSVSGCPQQPTPPPHALHPDFGPLSLSHAPLLFLAPSQSPAPLLSPFVSGLPLPFWTLSLLPRLSISVGLSQLVTLSWRLSLICLTVFAFVCLSVLDGLCPSLSLPLISPRLSVSLCDLSLVLCLPPPLPAPPSPHPELSLGNRKFGGSERYWEGEARLLPPRDNAWGGGNPRIHRAFLWALVHAEANGEIMSPL